MQDTGANKARFKYNNGVSALLCNNCNVIIKEGNNFTDKEMLALKGKYKLEAQYCGKCHHHVINLCKVHEKAKYSEIYDAYYCPECKEWLEEVCSDGYCDFCKERPDKYE